MSAPAIAHGDPVPDGTQPLGLADGLARGPTIFPAGRFVFVGTDGYSTSSTYAGMWARTTRILHGLRRAGLKPGDKVILHFRSCADFIPSLWASLLAGTIPVPFRNDGDRGHLSRAPEILAHLRNVLDGPRIVTDTLDAKLNAALGLAARDLITLGDTEAHGSDADFFAAPPDEPRLLILSSGTTATPNLVMLSARALISRWWPALPDAGHAATFLSWSPFDHVMGLGITSPNLPTKVHLPTGTFVRSPKLWLSTLDRFRVTHATMTNFGMSLVARAAGDALAAGDRFDLSSVRKIAVGAEAISPNVCRQFIVALRPFGLRPDAIVLGYGLTECGPVLGGEHPFTSSDNPEENPFALLDKPAHGHSVRIVDEAGRLLAEGDVGAVEVRGPSMTSGYYGDEAGTRALFAADGWIRTGDRGRLDAGRTTITGRDKETIIIHARKFACVEVETVAESVVGVATALAVACGPPTDLEWPVSRGHFALFFVPSRMATDDPAALARSLRAAIAARFGAAPGYLVAIAEADIPRTSTGKVRRLDLAARLDAGEFDSRIIEPGSRPHRSHPAPPASETERQIASLWAQVLGGEDYRGEDDFFAVGGDSLSAEVTALALERMFKARLPAELLYEHPTIAALAEWIDRHLSRGTVSSTVPDATIPVRPGPPPRTDVSPEDENPGRGTQPDYPDFTRNPEMLAWALRVAESPGATPRDLFFSLDALVAFGRVDEADGLAGRIHTALRQSGRPVPPVIQRLAAVNAVLRRAGIGREIRQLGEFGQHLLSDKREAVLWKSGKSDRLLVVFNTMQGGFWVADTVLHCILRRKGTNILYLKDPSGRYFLGGLETFGKGFAPLLAGIASIARSEGIRDIRVMGFSSAGYTSLLAAAKLNAAAFLGFSIPTVVSDGQPLPGMPPAVRQELAAKNLLVDLKPLLRAGGAPRIGSLYYGDANTTDAAYANHLADLPNFTVTPLRSATHNSVLALLAAGLFDEAIMRLLA